MLALTRAAPIDENYTFRKVSYSTGLLDVLEFLAKTSTGNYFMTNGKGLLNKGGLLAISQDEFCNV